jgi:16S rRNA (guanine(966)-N(2))-methyltransferase RsmD
MRIIAGEYRRRLLSTPPDDSVTRPIPDRVKESLFGILRGHCQDAHVFDGFAGTGAIGLECASRGAARVVCVEMDRSVAALLRHNVESLGCADRVEVVNGDALGPGALARAPRPLTLAFLDPPYPLVEDPAGFRRVMAQARALVELLTPDGFLVLRTPWPLLHAAGGPPGAGTPVPPARSPEKGKRRRPPRNEWRRDVLDALDGRGPRRARAPHTPDEADQPDEPAPAQIEPVTAPCVPAPPPGTPADLSLPNATGPETHTYRGMAIHLYARAPGTSGG